MVTIGTTEPLDLVHMDFIGMETTLAMKKRPVVKTVLVLVDHFTQYIHAYTVQDQQATTVTKVLYNKYFLVFRFPHQLMSDNPPEVCREGTDSVMQLAECETGENITISPPVKWFH